MGFAGGVDVRYERVKDDSEVFSLSWKNGVAISLTREDLIRIYLVGKVKKCGLGYIKFVVPVRHSSSAIE